jgi:hypothetical protein
VTSEELKSKTDQITELLKLRMEQQHSYHDRKENMAHAAMLISLAIAAWVLTADPWPPCWVPTLHFSEKEVAAIGLGVVWLFVHVWMRWQLRYRRVASRHVAAYLKVLSHWAQEPPKKEELQFHSPSYEPSVYRFIDLVFPCKKARVRSDEDLAGYPKTVIDAFEEVPTSALDGENITSYGSILVLFLIITRAFV